MQKYIARHQCVKQAVPSTTSEGTSATILSMTEIITARLVYCPERMPLNTAKKLLANTLRCWWLLGLQALTSKQTAEALDKEYDEDLETPHYLICCDCTSTGKDSVIIVWFPYVTMLCCEILQNVSIASLLQNASDGQMKQDLNLSTYSERHTDLAATRQHMVA